MNTTHIRDFVREADKALRRQLAGYKRIHGLTPACGGCKGHHCCQQQIHIYPPEVAGLVHYIKTKAKDRKRIEESLSTWLEEFLSWDLDVQADEGKHFFKSRQCPFHIDDKCAVYPARPIACRSYYSLEEDEEKCRGDQGDTHVVKLLDTSLYHKFFLDQGHWTYVMPLIIGAVLWDGNPATQKAADALKGHAERVQHAWFEAKRKEFERKKEAQDG